MFAGWGTDAGFDENEPNCLMFLSESVQWIFPGDFTPPGIGLHFPNLEEDYES